MSAVLPYGARLTRAVRERGHLCVGIDPHPALLEQWSLPVSAAGAEQFAMVAIAAARDQVAIVKPQVAFFERYGADGFKALEQVIPAAQDAGLLVLADVKRGEIGTTMDAYAHAWLDPASKLSSDAMTVNPYLGVGALDSTFEAAAAWGKGVYVLCATSNPEARALQSAGGEDSVASRVAAGVAQRGRTRFREQLTRGELTSFGLVIGATVDLRSYGVDPASLIGTPVLAPGAGAQGGSAAAVRDSLGPLIEGTVISQSRSLLRAGPLDLPAAIEREAESTRRAVLA